MDKSAILSTRTRGQRSKTSVPTSVSDYKDIKELKEEVENLSKEVLTTRQEIEALKLELEEEIRGNKYLESQLSQNKAELQRTLVEFDAQQLDIVKLEQELRDQKAERAAEINHLIRQLADNKVQLKEYIEAADAAAREIEAEKRKCEKEKTELRDQQFTQLNNQRQRLKAEYSALNTRLEQENRVLSDKVHTLKLSFVAKTHELERVKNELEVTKLQLKKETKRANKIRDYHNEQVTKFQEAKRAQKERLEKCLRGERVSDWESENDSELEDNNTDPLQPTTSRRHHSGDKGERSGPEVRRFPTSACSGSTGLDRPPDSSRPLDPDSHQADQSGHLDSTEGRGESDKSTRHW